MEQLTVNVDYYLITHTPSIKMIVAVMAQAPSELNNSLVFNQP